MKNFFDAEAQRRRERQMKDGDAFSREAESRGWKQARVFVFIGKLDRCVASLLATKEFIVFSASLRLCVEGFSNA
jgi:hypothetical protein